MRILGIDPGLRITGFGVIEADGPRLSYVASGTIKTDTADIGRVRKEALAAVEELKRKGPGYKRDISFWGQVGEGAISLGCVAAAALGQIEFGIPCVLGGAATSAAVRYWSSPQ